MKYKKTYSFTVTVEVDGPDCTDLMDETGRKIGKHALGYDLIGIRGSHFEPWSIEEKRRNMVRDITYDLEQKAIQKLRDLGLDLYQKKALSVWRPLP